jgi:hypothetical protein
VGVTEYVRADIHAAALARVARLEAAGRRALSAMDEFGYSYDAEWFAAMDDLRAALEVEP